MALLATVVSLALAAYQTYTGVKASQEAEAERLRLEAEAPPEFEIAPEMRLAYLRSQEMAKRGFTPEEQAQFRQGVARQRATQQRMATDIAGGQIAPAIATGLRGREIEARGRFAAAGARQRIENIRYAGEAARPFQAVSGMETQRQLAERQRQLDYNLMQQQAAGGAIRAGLETAGRTIWHEATLKSYQDIHKQPTAGLIPPIAGAIQPITPAAGYDAGGIYDIYTPPTPGYGGQQPTFYG